MYADLTNPGFSIDTGNDNVVIRDVLETVRGGRTLGVTGYTLPVIKAGHVIIVETATGIHKPMPVLSDGTAYDALPTGHTFKGIEINSVLTTKPFAGIMLRGSVNPNAAPYAYTSAMKTAFTLITFLAD